MKDRIITYRRLLLLGLGLVGFSLVLLQCKTQAQAKNPPRAPINDTSEASPAMPSAEDNERAINILQNTKLEPGDVIVVWDQAASNASKGMHLIELPIFRIKVRVVNTEVDASMADLKRACLFGLSLCRGTLSPINLAPQMVKHTSIMQKKPTEYQEITKLQQGDSFQYDVKTNYLSHAENKMTTKGDAGIADTGVSIRVDDSLGALIPGSYREFDLLVGSNGHLSVIKDKEASVVDLHAIGFAHILDHEGKRVGVISANWSSYASSYGQVATIRDAAGKDQVMIEIKSDTNNRNQVLYSQINDDGTVNPIPFAKTTYQNNNQLTTFTEKPPENLDQRIVITTPTILHYWFGGSLGSLRAN